MKIQSALLISLLTLLSHFTSAQSGDINTLVIIGNNIGTVSMKKNSLINVFKGRLDSWNNTTTVKIVLPSQKNESATLTAKVIYGTTVKGMQKFWLSLVFQGRANPPVFLDSDEEIIRYVQKNPGSIGIIQKGMDYPKSLQINITN
jgi:hypothetical protein